MMTTTKDDFINEPPRATPVVLEADVCVLGGSCTGVFAAIRAARRGARVVIVERLGSFGGVATVSLVNVWHSLLDTVYEREIIAGLTRETMDRLRARDAVIDQARNPSWAFAFNAQELMITLDEMVVEAGVVPLLHTAFVDAVAENGRIAAVIVENKSGRGAIRAAQFIDATGDGDVAARLGLPCYRANQLQPSTTCATFSDWSRLKGWDLNKALIEHGAEFGLAEGFVWSAPIPGSDVRMLAGTRVYGADCSDAAALTHSEIEGRRQVRAISDIIAKYSPAGRLAIQALPARIGIRESRHVRCRYQLTGDDVLYGRRFEDAIANGSYRVDVHHQDKPGITLRYLDGTEEYARPGHSSTVGRWRPETPTDPTFYQVPYRSITPEGIANLLVAGRMLDADPLAHAAVRVMVNMNQTGEAAGVAATLALDEGIAVGDVDPARLRKTLADGGSSII